jgi:hypothetical protein
MFNSKPWLMFSSVVFSIILTFNTPCFASRWWEVATATSSGSITYLDLDTITFYDNGMVTAWSKNILKNKQNLITEDIYIRGTKVNYFVGYEEYDCTNKMSRGLEESTYDASSRFLNTYSNYSYALFTRVRPDSVGHSKLELVCKAKELGLNGSDFYNFLAQERANPDKLMWERYISSLVNDFDQNVDSSIATYHNGKNDEFVSLFFKAKIYLDRSERFAEKHLQDNKNPLFQKIYSRQLGIAKLIEDQPNIDRYTSLLSPFSSSPQSELLANPELNSEILKTSSPNIPNEEPKQVKTLKKGWWTKKPLNPDEMTD